MHNLTSTFFGLGSILILVISYSFVVFEKKLRLPKSIPVIIGACFIWVLVAWCYKGIGASGDAEELFRHAVMEYGEILLFLLVAMTYVNTLEERNVFASLHARIMTANLSLRQIFWTTGIISFFLSAFADNLTTALIMGTVVSTIGKGNARFLVVAFVNIVVAANAGGAFSPFGDITTLMVWQKEKLAFFDFFKIFLPSLANWFIPALIMSLSIERGVRPASVHESFPIKEGGIFIVGLGVLTLVLAILARTLLSLPPLAGMMLGLGFLKLYSVMHLHQYEVKNFRQPERIMFFSEEHAGYLEDYIEKNYKPKHRPFDIFKSIRRAEWDTLFFFFGVVFCISGISAFGYLASVSGYLYQELGATPANILVGIASAIVDNIPIMFSVLSMNPQMPEMQWLLVTLTAGVGGSLLSIGSAAGVALMGTERKIYTFQAHLKWTWAIALGYFGSIGVHFLING